jgi:uncharacterized protein YycO
MSGEITGNYYSGPLEWGRAVPVKDHLISDPDDFVITGTETENSRPLLYGPDGSAVSSGQSRKVSLALGLLGGVGFAVTAMTGNTSVMAMGCAPAELVTGYVGHKIHTRKLNRKDRRKMFKKIKGALKNHKKGHPREPLPTNLVLPDDYKFKSNTGTAVGRAMFMAGALTLLGGCMAVAFIPNKYNQRTKKPFNQEQIDQIKTQLKPGDIVLTRSSMHQTFHYFLKSTHGHFYSHAATYVGDGNIIDSYDKPDRQNVDTFFKKMTEIAVLRPRYQSEKQIEDQNKYLEKQIGKPYDIFFRTDETETFYCSELTVRGMEASGVDAKIPGHAILGHAYVLPEDFKKSKDIDMVGEFRSNDPF